jgi:hypothetical protein
MGINGHLDITSSSRTHQVELAGLRSSFRVARDPFRIAMVAFRLTPRLPVDRRTVTAIA